MRNRQYFERKFIDYFMLDKNFALFFIGERKEND